MKFKPVCLATLVALGVAPVQAAVTAEDSYIDGNAFVYTFSATRIAANETAFLFTLDANDFDFVSYLTSFAAPAYNVVGGLSAANYVISQVMIDSTVWVPPTGNDIQLGSIVLTPASVVHVIVSGQWQSAGANFNGQLVLTPIPEPETYALMLAGLGAVGFLAMRRRQRV